LLNEIKGQQAQCQQCQQTFPQDALPPAPRPAERADKPQPAIVYIPAQKSEDVSNEE
jgi:hypothetical protein